ncbi:DoxX family protein [Paenibacillus roseipurpureus]|uniref:DoxX family protein n=1 Tax=Paenibacillus roseopurpureus TaxID=2918901 RepID=A0AA96RN33_9BACL|nr:DoxX family protein [Paenibacillus sp. MBLB1832]WNR46909.1 DoxX family protein [Paenibacillus sp. MBLB1832]
MKWVVRILHGLIALNFLFSGASKLFSTASQIRELFTDKLGTPVSLIYTVGVFEVLAGLILIAGYRSQKAAASSLMIMIVIMIGATFTNLAAGLVTDAAVPLLVLVFVAVLLYLKRETLKSLRFIIRRSINTSK